MQKAKCYQPTQSAHPKKQHQKRIYPAHTNDENYGEKFLVQRGSEKYKRKTICVDKKKKKKIVK